MPGGSEPDGLLKSRRRSAVRPRGLPLVGEARAANSAGDTANENSALNNSSSVERGTVHVPFTPALASRHDASTGSKGAGIGTTGKSLVLMPRCWRDMCECSELRDLATVPHSTHRYPGQTVCLSSK